MTRAPAPSPMTMPRRPRAKGRQVSGAMTRRPSHARIVPRLRQPSVPPVIAAVTAPRRTMSKAIPIAWLADAHALATAKAGPWIPCSIVTWLTAEFSIMRGIVKGWTRVDFLRKRRS